MQQRKAIRHLGLGLQHLPHFRKFSSLHSPTSPSLIPKQYDQYDTVPVIASNAAPSSAAPEVPVVQQQDPADQQAPQPPEMSEKPNVTPQSPLVKKELPILSKEEKIEYRDENGNILDPEQVSALAGKVSFKTRYETRTRIIDAQGNEIHEGLVDARQGEEGVAPPHPDAEGRNPETGDKKEAEASEHPPTVAVGDDKLKEKSVEGQTGSPRPGSEAQEATK